MPWLLVQIHDSIRCSHKRYTNRHLSQHIYCGTVTNFEFVPMVQEMSFKRFLILSSGDSPVRWSGAIYVNLNECIMGNIQVKFYEIWTGGSGDV